MSRRVLGLAVALQCGLLVTLQVSASYHQFGTFLDDLERSDHFIQVDRVRVTRVQETGPVSINLSLSTLYLPPVANTANRN